MSSALLVRFRPAGPWRLGPDNGARTQTGKLLHSDSLYSAITLAMGDCGWMDEWIAATAESQIPAVRISSGYPFTGSTLLVVPPRTVWPPAQGGKLRWKTARFVPLTLVPRLLAGEELADDQWAVDPVSECLLPVFRNSVAAAPFRVVQRVLAPVDRVTGATESVDRVACLQFAQGGGIWFIAEFADDASRSTWAGRMRSVARLLADSGIGGGRSRGWGRSREPQFGNVELPEFLTGIAASAEGETAWWTVSLFSPSNADKVEWDRGTYTVVARAGRTESGELKPASRMVAEGSVLVSGSPPSGMARNVSPAELSHAVYRSGIALTVRIPFQQRQRWELLDHAAAPAAAEIATAPETSVPESEALPSGEDAAWDAPAEQGAAPEEMAAELTTDSSTEPEPQASTESSAEPSPELASPTEEAPSDAESLDVADAEPQTRAVEQPPADSMPAPDETVSPESAPIDEPQAVPDAGIIDEIPVGIDLPVTESPAEQPEAAEDVTSTDIVPGEDPNAAGIEPAADKPEDAGYPKKDEEDQP